MAATFAQNQPFSDLVAMFLAEAIRTRRTSLARAAEISQRVISRLASATSEISALKILTDIEKDFQEVFTLKQALHFGYEPSQVKVFEKEIKEYAARIFTQDLQRSNVFLQDASRPDMTIQQMCVKYPDFCSYLMTTSDKAGLLSEIGAK